MVNPIKLNSNEYGNESPIIIREKQSLNNMNNENIINGINYEKIIRDKNAEIERLNQELKSAKQIIGELGRENLQSRAITGITESELESDSRIPRDTNIITQDNKTKSYLPNNFITINNSNKIKLKSDFKLNLSKENLKLKISNLSKVSNIIKTKSSDLINYLGCITTRNIPKQYSDSVFNIESQGNEKFIPKKKSIRDNLLNMVNSGNDNVNRNQKQNLRQGIINELNEDYTTPITKISKLIKPYNDSYYGSYSGNRKYTTSYEGTNMTTSENNINNDNQTTELNSIRVRMNLLLKKFIAKKREVRAKK